MAQGKSSLALALPLIIPLATLHAQSQREIHPRSCAGSDRVLPANGDVQKGRVRVSYWTDGDSTRLDAGSPLTARVMALMTGHGPSPEPVAQLTVFLHSAEAKSVEGGEQPPVVMLVTDDSVSQELSPVMFGRFVSIGPTAPPARIIRVPLSAELDPPDLVAIARSRHAVIHVGGITIPIRDGDRRDIAALYVAMICGIE